MSTRAFDTSLVFLLTISVIIISVVILAWKAIRAELMREMYDLIRDKSDYNTRYMEAETEEIEEFLEKKG